MATVALVDIRGVLTGYKRVKKADWVIGHGQVPVPDGCDLAVGNYRYDLEREAWIPLGRGYSVDRDRAIADALAALATAAGVSLPDESRRWLTAKLGDNWGAKL